LHSRTQELAVLSHKPIKLRLSLLQSHLAFFSFCYTYNGSRPLHILCFLSDSKVSYNGTLNTMPKNLHNAITDVPGIRVGHAQDDTGITVAP
jgi:hypothetical protein